MDAARYPAGAVLRLQRLAGNAAACALLRDRALPAVQRVGTQPIEAGSGNKLAAAMGRRDKIVIRKRDDGNWTVAEAPSWWPTVKSGETYVTAFVQPYEADPAELWLLTLGAQNPGRWGGAAGQHSFAGGAQAMAAGEAKWHATADSEKRDARVVVIEAVNQQTTTYGLAPADPRATQSEVLADYQCLIFFGDKFKESGYSTDAELADVTDPADLKPGQYMKTTIPVSATQKAKLLSQGTTPAEDQYTYRPTADDRRRNADLRGPATPTPTPMPNNTNNNSLAAAPPTTPTTTTTTTTTSDQPEAQAPGPQPPIGGAAPLTTEQTGTGQPPVSMLVPAPATPMDEQATITKRDAGAVEEDGDKDEDRTKRLRTGTDG